MKTRMHTHFTHLTVSSAPVNSARLTSALIKRLLTLGLITLCVATSLTITPRHASALSACFDADAEVDVIKVEGAVRSDPESIRRLIKHPDDGPLRCHIIREDIKRIFRQNLYRDVSVELKTEQLEDDEEESALIYRVVERRQVRAIRYEGNDELSKDDITEVVDLKPFTVLDLPLVKENSEKIKQLYIEKGFFLAEVSSDVVEVTDQQVDVVFRIREAQEIKVAQIKIIGNRALSDEKLKGFLETREEDLLSFLSGAGTFDREAFKRDQSRLLQLYYMEGYMQVVVSQPTVVISPDRSKLYITLRVDEGERFKVGMIDVSGDLLKPREELIKRFKMREGDWFNSAELRAGMESISNIYKDLGYAYANVAPGYQLLADMRVVDLNIEIKRGPLVKIGRVSVVGNTTTRDKVIRREMRIVEGDTFSLKLIKRSQALIQRLGFFESVTVEPVPSQDPERMDLLVRVKEKPTGTFQVGAGFSSIESFVGQVQVAQNNLLGRGQNLSLQATFSSLRSMANLRFSENYLFDTRLQMSANVYRFETNFFNFIRNSLGGNLTIGYPLTDDLTISTTYTIEEVEASQGGFGTNISNTSVTPSSYFNNGITSSLRLSMFYDTRNNRLFPSKGTFVSGSVESASPYLGSTNEFMRYNLRHRYYIDLSRGMVLKSNINWGLIQSANASGVPIFERYFLGGPLSVRGFFRNSLGPELQTPVTNSPAAPTTDFVIGGTEQLFFNLEFEFPIIQQVGIRGVGFLDGGNTFNQPGDYLDKVDQFRFAWGLGVRWFSPMGPLRFEWGFPFDPVGNEKDVVFEFSIGNFF